MAFLRVGLFFAAALSLAACEQKSESKKTVDGPLTLSVSGTEFSPHHQHSLRMVLVDRASRSIVAEQQFAIGADGTFTGSYDGALEKGKSYYLAYFADVNGNGTCDNPPDDHTWTVKIDNVDAAKTINLSHNFSFSENCHMFSNETLKTSTGTDILLTGRIALDANITDATDLTAGQPLSGAAVFVQGVPDQEALTDAQGNFTLALKIPPDLNGSELTADALKLIAWYTEREDYSTPAKLANSRFGAISDIAGTGGTVDMGQISLTRTNRVRVRINSTVDDAGVTGCTLRLFGFDFQVVSVEASAGIYEIDYLPQATYVMGITCSGYEYKEFDLEVVAGTNSDKWIEFPPVKLQPM